MLFESECDLNLELDGGGLWFWRWMGLIWQWVLDFGWLDFWKTDGDGGGFKFLGWV